MLLNTKKLAFLGLLLAVTVLLIIFSGVFEFNTLFLLGAAAFCVGVAIREGGIRIGFGFYMGAILLSLMLAPNKLYIITFGAMGLYLLLEEFAFEKLTHSKGKINRKRLFLGLKYVAFNVMYLPLLYFLPSLIYQGKISKEFWLVLILVGQVALYIFDMAYYYFQKQVWEKIRNKLQL